MMSEYPFQDSWPIEGFPMDEAPWVQIRIKQPSESTYWEVRLYFWPTKNESDNIRVQMTNKAGKVLEPHRITQCIARFETKEEAYHFVHQMHQSKNKKHLFPPLSGIDNASLDKVRMNSSAEHRPRL
ncbi:MAG: hypothetical protein MPK05_05785 [Gammaproteobacteria bacterium]|nr:hypothetical protein [Gammaproteobacteria bacterium]